MRNAAAAAVLALAVLAGCTAAPPPAPTNTLVRPTDTPAPVPTATPLAAPTATPVPAILTAGPVNYLPSPEQIPAAYVYAPQRERLLTQPNLSGVLRTYSRLDTSRNEGLVQIGVTVADTE